MLNRILLDLLTAWMTLDARSWTLCWKHFSNSSMYCISSMHLYLRCGKTKSAQLLGFTPAPENWTEAGGRTLRQLINFLCLLEFLELFPRDSSICKNQQVHFWLTLAPSVHLFCTPYRPGMSAHIELLRFLLFIKLHFGSICACKVGGPISDSYHAFH